MTPDKANPPNGENGGLPKPSGRRSAGSSYATPPDATPDDGEARVGDGFRFGAVSTRAIRDPKVTAAMLRVLAEIATFADKDGWCVVRQAVVGDHLGISQQAVAKHVKVLVGLGHLIVEARYDENDNSRRASRYCVRLDPPTTPEVVTPTTLEVVPPTTPEVVARRTDLDNRPSEQTAAPAAPPPRSSKNPVKQRADALTKAWWETRTPRPLQKFVAVRGLVEKALTAGHAPEAVIAAIKACQDDPPIVSWKLEKALAAQRPKQRQHDPRGLNADRNVE